jgi:hypothetical protein
MCSGTYMMEKVKRFTPKSTTQLNLLSRKIFEKHIDKDAKKSLLISGKVTPNCYD